MVYYIDIFMYVSVYGVRELFPCKKMANKTYKKYMEAEIQVVKRRDGPYRILVGRQTVP